MSGKRAVVLAVVVMLSAFGVLAAIFGHRVEDYSAVSAGMTNGQSSQAVISNEDNAIFFAENYDFIDMFGNPQHWDDEKNMAADLNHDGVDEDFAIAKSRHEGILLKGSAKRDGNWESVNFWSDRVFELFRSASARSETQAQTLKAKHFLTGDISGLLWLLKEGSYIVEGGCIVDDDFIQISCCDIDEDGIKEVLVSAGNKKNKNVTVIYEYSEEGKAPFAYRGYISCDTAVEYRGDKVLWAYRGNQTDNRYDAYLYDGERISEIEKNK